MVKLSAADFASATNKMCQDSGVRKTRLVMKFRSSDGSLSIRSTDNRTTFTSDIRTATEMKMVEQLVAEYVSKCTKLCSTEMKNEASKKGAKGKKKK